MLMIIPQINGSLSVFPGDEGEQHPHTFKSSSFSIPTQCVYCKASTSVARRYKLCTLTCRIQSSIWGLSKQGKSCKDCGISVHSKCELKVRSVVIYVYAT